MTMIDAEQKSVIDQLIKKIRGVLESLMSYAIVERTISASYNEGLSDVEVSLRPNINFQPNRHTIKFLADYTFDNIKDMNDELVGKLRRELIAGMMNGESTRELSTRVRDVMSVGHVRARAIARTETHRAYNYGGAFAAKQSGLQLRKYAFNPSPKTDICKHITAQEPILLSEEFYYGGSHWESPPFHVNCRSKLLFVREDA